MDKSLMRSLYCLYTCVTPKIATQRLGKHVYTSRITHATIEELLDPRYYLCGSV
jgi:hypothetical protein